MSAEQLTGFEDYIERNQLVSAKYARYHRMWAERWLAFTGRRGGEDRTNIEHRTPNAQRQSRGAHQPWPSTGTTLRSDCLSSTG